MSNIYSQFANASSSNKTTSNQGGEVFKASMSTMVDRFLILGTESGSYYVNAQKLTEQNANNLIAAIRKDGTGVVQRIVEISQSGRAPKNDPALFALALVMTYGDDSAKRSAYTAVNSVARTGTHILHLADYIHGLRSWGRGVRGAFAGWYNSKTPMQVAYQITKYANRDGWTHKDILRLAHVKPITTTHDALFSDTVGKAKEVDIDINVSDYMTAIDRIKTDISITEIVSLIRENNLPREVIPTEFLNRKEIWEALLPHMGMTALIRNLAKMTNIGFIEQTGDIKMEVMRRLTDADMIQEARVHPVALLQALRTYSSGHGDRGSLVWNPVHQIVDALDSAFDMSFKNITPTNKRVGMFFDVSGSMDCKVLGLSSLTCREASAAMAMATVRTETDFVTMKFNSVLSPVEIGSRDSLKTATTKLHDARFGGTDCSQPMIWAKNRDIKLDAFIVYTDSENARNIITPTQALENYRQATGIDAKFIVAAMAANQFSVADPNDPNSMDVVGFDTNAPAIMSDFIRGTL